MDRQDPTVPPAMSQDGSPGNLAGVGAGAGAAWAGPGATWSLVVPTVRDATFEILRRHGMTTLFGNPGSSEVPFLAGFPADFTYVLGLHEGAVVGMAVGFAQARRGPVVVNLHTAAGLGNAMGALGTAWHNRAPLVLIVGQQARSHLALGPFLAAEHLDRMPEPYVKWAVTPARPEDVPGAVERAMAVATAAPEGPAVVVVPMDDWDVPLAELPVPHTVVRCAEASDAVVDQIARQIDAARRPLIVAGAGVDRDGAWAGAVALAERLGAPVWDEPMGARVGFPQDHPLYAGGLERSRTGVYDRLRGHDLAIVLGAPVFRYYMPEPADGPIVPDGCAVLQLTGDQDDAARCPAGTSVVARLDTLLPRVARAVAARDRTADDGPPPPRPGLPANVPAPANLPANVPATANGAANVPVNGAVTAERLVDVLRALVPPEMVVVEECPSVRPVLDAGLPSTVPGGWSSSGNGWLGYGLSGAIGLALGNPDRPVLCVVGDGSTLFGVQALWTAARYRVPVVFCVLVNQAYGVLAGLVRDYDAAARIPGTDLSGIDIAGLAVALGVPAVVVDDAGSLAAALRSVLPRNGTGGPAGPVVLQIQMAPPRPGS